MTSLQEIATRVGLQDQSALNRSCKDYLLPALSGYFHPWREAAPFLGLGEIDIHDVEKNYGSEAERRVGALYRWKATNGLKATYSMLVMSLLSVGRVDNAENICSFLLHVQKRESAKYLRPPMSPTHGISSHQSFPPLLHQATATKYTDIRMDIPAIKPPPRMNPDRVQYSDISHETPLPSIPIKHQSLPRNYAGKLHQDDFSKDSQPDRLLSRSRVNTTPSSELSEIESQPQPPPIPPRTYKEIKPAFQPFDPADHFAWLDSDDEKDVESIDNQIARLDEKYVVIENLVLETIRQQSIPVKKMLQWVLVLPMMLKAQFSESLQAQRKEMSDASNVDELFLILSQYWNSLQPSLLEHLVTKLQDTRLRIRMKDYLRDLENFRKCTILGEFVDKWMGVVPSGLEEFIVELGEEWRGKTMHDLELFRVQLSRQKCFNGHMPLTKRVISGSIMVVFAVSHNVRFKGKEFWYFLRRHGILRVMMKGRCVLDLVNTKIEEIEESDDTSSDSSSHYSSSDDSDGLKSLSESSNECLFPYTMSRQLKWHPVADCLVLSSDRLVAESNNNNRGEVHVSEPLHRTGEFEFKIEERKGHDIIIRDGFFGIGIQRRQCKSPPPLYTLPGRCIWQTGAIYNTLKNSSSIVGYSNACDLDLLVPGDRVGIMITIEGNLEFFVNGKSQGIAAEGVYKVDSYSDLYPLIKLPAGFIVRITAGATQIDVIRLQDLCIECVAKSVKSFEDVQSLNLPLIIKDEILKVLLNPKEDFLCH